MKYLSDYMEKKETEAFEKHGAFFAFSKKQFEEGARKVGANAANKLCDMGSGLYCLSKNADALNDELETIHKTAIVQDLQENGIEGVISRELGNHEAQITGSIEDTMDALEGYNISRKAVAQYYKEVYLPLCIENDWF